MKLTRSIALFLLVASAVANSQTSPAPYTTVFIYDDARQLVGTIRPDPDGRLLLFLCVDRSQQSSFAAAIDRSGG